MTQNKIKGIADDKGVIHNANKIIPDKNLKTHFIQALAELEDNCCHKKRKFPKTRLHRVNGVKEAIYRADIEKTSGWRIHVRYDDADHRVHLIEILEGSRHDDTQKVIKSKKQLYKQADIPNF